MSSSKPRLEADPDHRTRVTRQGSKSRARKRRARIIGWSVAGFLVLIVFCVAWVGTRAFVAKGDLEAIVPLTNELKDAALASDDAAISRASSEINKRATSAQNLTSDPVWRLGEFVPGVGANLTAARELSESVRNLSDNAVGPLARLVATVTISDFKPSDGVLQLDPIIEAQSSVSGASAALKEAKQRIEQIDTSNTLPPVKAAVERLESEVADLAPPIEALSNAVSLLPSMLGADTPRNYLLLFQNPAELRSSGGIPGALALLHTEQGKIELLQQASSSDFPRFTSPVIDIPDESRGLYGDILGEYVQDTTLTPDFDLTARLAQSMWEKRFGITVDGVISIDPVALSYLLKATGPVDTATGDQLTSENAVSLLLSEAYQRYALPAQQDLFFASSAKAVFDKVATGDLDTSRLISELAKAGSERRILVWNADPAEQNILKGTTLSGELVGEEADSPQLGLFLNDATGAKMDYYLDVKTSVGQISCRKDGLLYSAVSVTLTNNAPTDSALTLPAYVTGGGNFGVPPGNVKTMISFYAAPGMVNLGVSRDGKQTEAHSASHDGRQVNQLSVELQPGESATFVSGFAGQNVLTGAGDLQITPTINMNETSELALTCESALW